METPPRYNNKVYEEVLQWFKNSCSLFALSSGGPCKPLKDYAGTCPFPCPGLSQDSSPLIDRYLSRMAATGRGAPSRQILMKDLFGFDEVSS